MESKEFTDEELVICKSTPLLPLVQQLGYQPYRVGQYYAIRGKEDMSSMRINTRKNTWTRYSADIGGSATDLVMYLENMSFPEAVRFLLDYNGIAHQTPAYTQKTKSYRHLGYRWYQIDQKEGKVYAEPAIHTMTEAAEVQKEQPFMLPNANRDYSRVYAYLIQKRKLSKNVVDFFVNQRLIYESVKTHNAVFVGRDENGKIQHAILRGTYDREGKDAFKGMVSGSKPEYAFHYITDSPRLIVTEAPLDCMSYMQMEEYGRSGRLSCYLALGGRHDRALEWFLKTYPHIREIYLGVDLDRWGQDAYEKISEKYTTGEWQGRYKVKRIAAYGFKDWNEMLQWQSRLELEKICKNEWEMNGGLSASSRQRLEKDNLVFDVGEMQLQDRSEQKKPPFPTEQDYAEPPTSVELPDAYRNHYQIFKYFCEKKKLPEELIQYMIDKKLLYESAADHSAIFVSRDQAGVIQQARSCSTGEDGTCRIIEGSNPEYTFFVRNEENPDPKFKTVQVFETVVDALAGMSFVADMSAYSASAFDYRDLKDDYFVMDENTDERVLDRYLKEHPDIKIINLNFGKEQGSVAERLKERYCDGEWKERGFQVVISKFMNGSLSDDREVKSYHESYISFFEAQTEFYSEDEAKKTGHLSEISMHRLKKLGWDFDMESQMVKKPSEVVCPAEDVSVSMH